MIQETLVVWFIKFIEILIVSILSLVICLFFASLTGEQAFGTISVGIIFYFFSEIIRPYVKEIQNKLIKKLKKESNAY